MRPAGRTASISCRNRSRRVTYRLLSITTLINVGCQLEPFSEGTRTVTAANREALPSEWAQAETCGEAGTAQIEAIKAHEVTRHPR